jgi:hypothetical protein
MNSNAAARKRRAPQEVQQPSSLQQQNRQMTPGTGAGPGASAGASPTALTLPQVINVIDRRIIALETFVKETKENTVSRNTNSESNNGENDLDTESINNILQEFSSRFDILAEEIGNLKDTVLKLQTYTMDVNKMLVDERIHILSDIDNDKDAKLTKQSNNIKLEEMSFSTFELADEITGVNVNT